MINTNSQSFNSYGVDKSSGTDGKSTEKNPDKNLENQDTNAGNNPYQDADNADINKENTRNSEHPVTVVEFDNQKSGVAGLYSKSEYTPEEAKIAEFIAKIKDDTFAAILKSFDQMLANARKMMEENQRILREKVIPREEARKKDLIKLEIKKQTLGLS